jgi:hypothetical protein
MVAVLEPGDTHKLLAVLPAVAAAAAAPGSSSSSTKASSGLTAATGGAAAGLSGPASRSSSSSNLAEPFRLCCAERLVSKVVVCWEMITGAAAASGQLPHGRVQLAPVDVAANLTPGGRGTRAKQGISPCQQR